MRTGREKPPVRREPPKTTEWSDFPPRVEGIPHFQAYQFDPHLGRPGRPGAAERIEFALSPEGHATVHGDKSLRYKVAKLLTEPHSIFQDAAFRV